MPSQLEPALEERFGEVLEGLRRGRVEPSPALTNRVRMLSRLEPAPPRRLVTRRRLVFALAAAVLVAAFAAGVLFRSGGNEQPAGEAVSGGGGSVERSLPSVQGAPQPQPGRLQDYRAQLTIRVSGAGGVSRATQQAMSIAQSVGGYVVSASYGGAGTDSNLVLSVPVGRAQEAIGRLSSLGQLAGQHFSLQDLQSAVDELDARADRLQQRIAELSRQLRNRNLTEAERVALRNRLEQAQRELQDVLAQRDGTAAQGRSAEISLRLTAATAAAHDSGRGVLGRAVDALARVWVWVLAVLIVAVPFAVLLGAAVLAGRRLRRRANERLLGA